MQSFRERCGFHGNQQNYQSAPQDSSRLENYRHQSQPGLNCERQRQVTKGYYAQTSYQDGYESSAGEKYPRGDKHMNVQQLQGRVSFASFPEGSVYSGQYSAEDGLQNWGPSQALAGTKYEGGLVKKASGEGRGYQDPSGQMQFRSHNLHHPQQPSHPYAKLPRQKVQNDVTPSPLSFSQSTHFNQSFPTASTYSSVPGSSQVSHSFKSCTAPSNPPHERAMATTNQRVQAMHAYQSSRMATYEQPQRHHAQETLHYQNMAKYQHYGQQGQAYCQSETPSRNTEQYYQTFSPSASHSPARSVGRSPSYSSTPSPLMPNLENFQYSQQQHSASTFPMGISDHSHYMPLLNPSPTGNSSPDSQPKNMQNDKIPETLLSDLSLQSLTALTSQVENISNTVQQLLLSKSGVPQKKGLKTSPRTPEQMKGQHCSPESNTYSTDQLGTPLSETLGTPQSVHAEIQDADYLSGSEDQLERNYLYCGPGRSPGRANSLKMKPESISTCSVTSPDNMSTKSDDSFQSIHANLPLETFAKLVSSERECPHLLVNALSHEELSTEIIALQDAIDNEKAEKAWVPSPTLTNKNNSPKSPFNLENHTDCAETAAKNTWSDQGTNEHVPDDMKKNLPEKAQTPIGKDFEEEYFKKEEFPSVQTKATETTENAVNFSPDNNISAVVSSESCNSFSNTNSTCSKTTDPFDWPDKNVSESCLRWKDIELTLRSSDLQKGLFQTKESKIDCQVDVPDVETPLENDSGEEFNKDGAEDIAYNDDHKADNEKWLEDSRDCYTGDDFNDIPDLPSQKESNLEPEDYSSLCDFSDRKSFLYEASPPKPLREVEAFSSVVNTPESEENPSTEEKENSVPSSQLSGHSIMLLGPAVGTECKVNSWFESTLSHIKNNGDIKETREEDADVKTPEPAPIPEVGEEKHKMEDQHQQMKTEEELEGTHLCVTQNPCRFSEHEEADRQPQVQPSDMAAIANEMIKKEGEKAMVPSPVTKAPMVEETPLRMCTRSSTSKVEPQVHGPVVGLKTSVPEKLTKRGAFGVKQRAPFKPGRRGGKSAMKVMTAPSDQNAFILQGKTPGTLSGNQKAKEKVINILKDERSMILRSRSKNQEIFQTKRRKGKRGMSLVLKKRTTLKKIIANNCTLPDTFKLVPKVRQRMKLSKPGVAINGKTAERALHSLKRKPSFLSPVPAKKRKLILRGKTAKEEKCEASTKLFKKIKSTKKEKVKLSIARKKTCKVILNTPSVRVTPEVCLKIATRPTYTGTMKTKVLPPRKGRGLKLEAIVQKMTSPNQKKQGGIGAGPHGTGWPANSHLHALEHGKDLRDSSIVSVDSETKMLDQDMAQNTLTLDSDVHSLNCRRYKNKSMKGKFLQKKKKVGTNSLLAEFVTHPVAAKLENNSIGTGKARPVPKKKIRRGRSRGMISNSKAEAKKLVGATHSVLPTSGEKGQSENALLAGKLQSGEYKHTKLKESSILPDESTTQTRKRKRNKFPVFNGYAKRQRKCPPRNKSANQAAGSKRRTKRRNAPLISPKEPEIKLKYVSSKPTRAESRVRHFTPYIKVEKRNKFTTTCTVVNTPGEETRLIKERNTSHTLPPKVSLASHGTLPLSSRMQLGPLVCKSVAAGCLVCCLCRCPANYKDLGDLCGPYYPMDCLPNKKSRPKEKVKTEEPLVEKPHKAADSGCLTASVRTSCTDGGATESIKHNNLRSSARGFLRKLPSCYCCSKKADVSEVEKPRRHHCSKTPDPPPPEPTPETQEHWVHEACAVWTSGVYLVAGKLYGIHEAMQMAATGTCPKCQKPGATVGCSHQGCTQSYHYTCAVETGCLLNEENFSLRCPKHKRHLV